MAWEEHSLLRGTARHRAPSHRSALHVGSPSGPARLGSRAVRPAGPTEASGWHPSREGRLPVHSTLGGTAPGLPCG